MRHRSGAIAAAMLLVVVGAGLVSAADPPAIPAAPAFTAQQLLAAPRGEWITNGGTLYNQRYSPLSLINRDNVKDLRAGSPIGRTSRGVALGEGKVFVGIADGRLAALDQRTGQVAWQVQAERWQDGYAITAAPLYFDGGGPTLIGRMDAAQIRLITTTGRNSIPTFRDIYDANQIRDVSEYITTVLPGRGAATAKP